MSSGLANFQIGKLGLTKNFIESLKNAFKTRKIIKISFLRSSSRDKKEIKSMSGEICEKLGDKEHRYDFTTIGFKTTLRKFRKRG